MNIYLSLPFAAGNVTKAGHERWIEVEGFDFELDNGAGAQGTSNNKNTSSRAHFGPLTVTKRIDFTSPNTFVNVAGGNGADPVLLDVCDNQGIWIQYRLKNAKLISRSIKVDKNDAVEIIKFSYASILETVFDRGVDAEDGLKNLGGYDLVQNTTIYH